MNRTKPESIAIIQLARMGDLVQTLPLLRALRRERPEAQISLLVDSRNEELARRLKCVDAVFPVDPSRLLDRKTRPGKALVEGYRRAENWLAPIREKRFG